MPTDVIGGADLRVAGGDAREPSLPMAILDCRSFVAEWAIWPDGGGVMALERMVGSIATTELRCDFWSGEGVRGLATPAIFRVIACNRRPGYQRCL